MFQGIIFNHFHKALNPESRAFQLVHRRWGGGGWFQTFQVLKVRLKLWILACFQGREELFQIGNYREKQSHFYTFSNRKLFLLTSLNRYRFHWQNTPEINISQPPKLFSATNLDFPLNKQQTPQTFSAFT